MTTIIQHPLMIRRVRMDDHIGTNRECTGVVANPVADEKARNIRIVAHGRHVVVKLKNQTKNIKFRV